MIITKIRLQEEIQSPWPLPFCDFVFDSRAGENGYILKEALGLGPPNLASIVVGFDTTGVPVMDSVPEKRDLVFRVGINSRMGQTNSELRDELYRYVSKSVLISLMNDSIVIAQTTGFIRQFETVHFSNQPEIVVTIECDDGDFSAPESLDIPFSELSTTTPVVNYEKGTAPTGFNLQFSYKTTRPGFTIFGYSQGWPVRPSAGHLEFAIVYPFINGDLVSISTQTKSQSVTVLRAGVTTDLAGYLNGGAVWPRLHSGANGMQWTYLAAWLDLVSANYVPKYWGV